VIEPPDPLQRRELHVLTTTPRSAATDDLGLEEADDSLGQRVVVRVATASDRRLDARLYQALGVANGVAREPRPVQDARARQLARLSTTIGRNTEPSNRVQPHQGLGRREKTVVSVKAHRGHGCRKIAVGQCANLPQIIECVFGSLGRDVQPRPSARVMST
jgi:hypothetical protein